MLNQHHPDDERLSALASHDDDATADASLVSHVESCATCTHLVDELGALRISLGELPDLRPHRPLQLLPPVPDTRIAGAALWIRRLFGPALAAGAAIAMVGLVGTATPAFDGMASGGAAVEDVATDIEGAAPGAEADGAGRDAEAPQASDSAFGAASGDVEGEGEVAAQESEADAFESVESTDRNLPAERSPWPMVLFTGVALMIGVGLLRWILVPRAG